tara:strand:- start:1198 stop:2598 length:1401 start_codon:yes stop_codon:yes gene_type:complete
MNYRKTLLLILLLAVLMRALPLTIDSMTGPDPWFHARMAETVIENKTLLEYDALSMQGRDYSYAPLFHTILASFSILSSIQVISLTPLLPILYGSIIVLLVFAFARRIFGSNSLALFSALAIAIMPLHLLRTAAYARPDSLALLIVPAIIFLIYTKKFLPATILVIPLVLLHPLSSLYLFLFLLTWMLVARVKRLDFVHRKVFILMLVGVLVWLLWLYSLPFSPLDYVSKVSLESVENVRPSFLNFFTFFTFSWIFIIIGLLKFDLKKNLFLPAWLLFSFFYGIFSSRLFIFVSIPAAIIAAGGFSLIFEKTRRYFPILIALLFVLSIIPIMNEVNSTTRFINPAEKKAMQWLQQIPIDSVLASQWDRGHPLAYLTGRQVVMDGYFEFAPQLDERNESMKILASSSNCETLQAEKEKWGIDYFFVHNSALESLTYKNGLLEADCGFISQVYASNNAKIISFDLIHS